MKKKKAVKNVDDDFVDVVPEKVEDVVKPDVQKPVSTHTKYKNVSVYTVIVGRYKFRPNEVQNVNHKLINDLQKNKIDRMIKSDMLKKL